MKPFTHFKYVFVLTTLLMAWMPSARMMAVDAVAATPYQEAFYDDLEEMKSDLHQYYRALVNLYNALYEELKQKATEEEAPELYQKYMEIGIFFRDAAEMIQRISTTDEVYACREYLSNIYKAISEWGEEIKAFQPATSDIAIDATNFPDENFRNWLLSQEYGQDGKLTEEEIAGVTYINVNHMNIQSLKGIELFTALIRLDCYDNQQTSLDVSKNTALTLLYCSLNQLTSLDVSKNTALTSLYCSQNQLTSLDISKNTALTDLFCDSNQLTSLDVSNNTALIVLNCSYNQLTSLDVSKNKVLGQIYCSVNNIDEAAMDALVACLPSVERGSFYVMIPSEEEERNVITSSQVTAAYAKGWKVYKLDAGNWVEMGDIHYDCIYEIGNESGWSENHMLSNKGGGVYRGFYYLDGEFKFKPNSDNWDGCYGKANGDAYAGTLTQDGPNIDAPEPGFYMIEINLYKMSYKLEKVVCISIIGFFNNWSEDVDMSYNKKQGCWETTLTVPDTEFKFRMNHDWTVNWGLDWNGTLDNLIQEGNNIPLSAGSYTIRLYLSCDGKHKATITDGGNEMAVPDEAIDLGLPSGTKWAPWNVGASKPEDYGGYYAWGETEEKEVYDWSTYIHCDGTEETCHDIGTDIAGTDFDVAHVKWGESWTMPTLEQVKELLDNCTSEWTTVNGINGRKFTSRINDNSIFLPAAGYCSGPDRAEGEIGNYRSSSLNESNPSIAHGIDFYSDKAYEWGFFRYYGLSVRPVYIESTASNIDFADARVKAICVENWDTNHDGELSYDEAAAVTELGKVFMDKFITSFDELQYFTGIKEIGEHDGTGGFLNCRQLTSIHIPSNVTSINQAAFGGCYKLSNVQFHDNEDITIAVGAFQNSTELNSITFPKGAHIYENPFYNCLNLKEILVDENNEELTSVEGVLFSKDMKTLIAYPNLKASQYTIPDGVVTIKNAFEGCSNVTAITIPSSVTFIGSSAFAYTNITSIQLPDGLEEIRSYLFAWCRNLREVNIPHSVTTIWRFSIAGTAITSLTIPSKVSSIREQAFWGNDQLEKVISEITEPFAIPENAFYKQDDTFTTATLYVPAGTKALYEATEGWNKFQNIVEMEGEEMAVPDEAIDLGLPSGTKWAPWNVGASKPEDYGGYFAWGETEEKEMYDWSTYIHCDGTEETCHDIGTDIAGTEYDVAHVKWGGQWQMPTMYQVQELLDNCSSEWTTINGINGRQFTGSNGNSIFIPAAGYRWHPSLIFVRSRGIYWSSSLSESSQSNAYNLLFDSGSTECSSGHSHETGRSVRPVSGGSNIPDTINDIPSSRHSTIYNLSGQRLTKPQRGVNIINGKKVIVK